MEGTEYTIQFKDLQEGITLNEEVDEVTGLSRLVVAEAADEKRQPAIVIKGAKGNKRYLMPSRAHLMIQDGDEVFPGDVLAKIPRETTRTKDITGGLPRVVELFEARKPRETAINHNRLGEPMCHTCKDLAVMSLPSGHWLPLERKIESVQALRSWIKTKGLLFVYQQR